MKTLYRILRLKQKLEVIDNLEKEKVWTTCTFVLAVKLLIIGKLDKGKLGEGRNYHIFIIPVFIKRH